MIGSVRRTASDGEVRNAMTGDKPQTRAKAHRGTLLFPMVMYVPMVMYGAVEEGHAQPNPPDSSRRAVKCAYP